MIETLEVIRADADDWENRASALELLTQLGSLAPPDLVEEISAEQDEEAEGVLVEWFDVDGDPDFTFDESELERTVEWVENRSNEFVPGYQEARAYLDLQSVRGEACGSRPDRPRVLLSDVPMPGRSTTSSTASGEDRNRSRATDRAPRTDRRSRSLGPLSV